MSEDHIVHSIISVHSLMLPRGALMQLAGSIVPVLRLTILKLVCGRMFPEYLPGPKQQLRPMLCMVRTL